MRGVGITEEVDQIKSINQADKIEFDQFELVKIKLIQKSGPNLINLSYLNLVNPIHMIKLSQLNGVIKLNLSDKLE